MKMNNENELHDVTFKIRYPSKKEKIIYAVKSILIDELTILAERRCKKSAIKPVDSLDMEAHGL